MIDRGSTPYVCSICSFICFDVYIISVFFFARGEVKGLSQQIIALTSLRKEGGVGVCVIAIDQ